MTFDEFKVLAKGMKSVYTKENFLPDAESIKIWFSLLKDIPYEVLNVAIQKYMMTNKFSPTIADLRELASEVTVGQITDWGDGWEQVLKAIRVYGSYNAGAALNSMDSITRKCVERLGFREICLSENIAVDRANFRMLYEQLANRQKEDAKLSLSIKTKLAELTDTKFLE
jgi:hypothetical protein